MIAKPGARADERLRFHACGKIDAGQPRRGCGEVDGADHARLHPAGPPAVGPEPFRNTYDDRNANAFIVEELFPPGHGAAVIAEKENDGALVQAFPLQALQHLAYLDIEILGAIQVEGEVLADGRVIGIVRRQNDARGADRVGGAAGKGAVRFREVDLRVEWLPCAAAAPVRAVERLIDLEIEVGLAGSPDAGRRGSHIGGMVPRPAEEMSKQRDAIGQSVAVVPVAAMLMRSDGGLVHPGGDRGPGSGAHRRGGERVGEADALRGKAIQVGCADQAVAVTAEIGAEIFGNDPQDIRARAFRRAGRGSRAQCGAADESTSGQWHVRTGEVRGCSISDGAPPGIARTA